MSDRERLDAERTRLIRTVMFDAVEEGAQNLLIARSDREQAEFVRLLDQEMGVAEEISRFQIERRVILPGPNELQTIPFAWSVTQRLSTPSTGMVVVVPADAASPDTLDPFTADSHWGLVYWPDVDGYYESCAAKDWESHWKSIAFRSDAQVAHKFVWRDPTLNIMVPDSVTGEIMHFDLSRPKEEILVDQPKVRSSWERIQAWDGKEVKGTWERRRPRRPR